MPASTIKDYRFTSVPLASIYDSATGKKEVARVFLGEWVKPLQPDAENGRLNVRYRGGEG